MKFLPWMMCGFIAATLFLPITSRAEEGETDALPVALVVFGDVDPSLIERARVWAEANLAIPVPLLAADADAAYDTFDEASAAAAAIMEQNRLGLVVLWKPASDVMNHGAFFPDARISIANMNAMITPDTKNEVIARRIERQVIRGIALVMGLEPNPNPHSAMFAYTTLEQLDAIGRNLDPPWLIRLQEKALAAGLPLDPDNSFNLVNPAQ